MARESRRSGEALEIEVEGRPAGPPQDPAASEAEIAVQAWVVEVDVVDSVDGDFNGAPQLEALAATREWQGADALDGMAGREAQELRVSDEPMAEELLADAVASRRQLLAERLDEARERGLGFVFEAALAVSEPDAGNSPVVEDDDVLRDQLAILDAAIDQLEWSITAEDGGAR